MLMSEKSTVDVEQLVDLDMAAFTSAMMQINPGDFWQVILRYPQLVREQLEGEDRAAWHLAKWLSAGGGNRPIHIEMEAYRRITGQRLDRQKNLDQARHHLAGLVKAIDSDPLLRIVLASLKLDTAAAFHDLDQILSDPGLSAFANAPRAARPTRLPERATYAAKAAIKNFFPPEYDQSQAARVFVKAWRLLEGDESCEHLSVKSIRATMNSAARNVEKEKVSSSASRWLAGKKL